MGWYYLQIGVVYDIGDLYKIRSGDISSSNYILLSPQEEINRLIRRQKKGAVWRLFLCFYVFFKFSEPLFPVSQLLQRCGNHSFNRVHAVFGFVKDYGLVALEYFVAYFHFRNAELFADFLANLCLHVVE